MKINRVNKRYPKSLKHTVNTSPDIVYNTLIINQKSSFKFSFDREIKNQFNVRKISKRGLEQSLPLSKEKLKTQQKPSRIIPLHFNSISNRVKTDNPSESVEKKKKKYLKPLKILQLSSYARKSIDELTEFEKEQAEKYTTYYFGKKKLFSIEEFTDQNGDALIEVGDSIIYRYEIKHQLGYGSFGHVYKAYDHKRKQYVALKIIRNNAKLNKQAKVEIKLLESCIVNPEQENYIIKMKHAFFFRGHACIIFQLLSLNLYDFLKNTNFVGLSIDMIRRFSIQILQGLSYLKSKDIIHCDLKPQNILLKSQNKSAIRIIDLGSGCFTNQQVYNYIQSRYYRAPQIILGLNNYTSAIDIWSFGCIIVQLFVGYPLFPGQSQSEQVSMFVELLGSPSLDIIERGARSKIYFQEGELRKKRKKKYRKRELKSLLRACSDSKFLSFVQSCLVWDHVKRITPKQALLHPFIVEGLPYELREQHEQKITKM